MSDEAKLGRILDDWARSGVPLEDAEVSEGRRERLVPLLANDIRRHAEERARRRRLSRWALGLAAAAAIALGVGAFATRPHAAHPASVSETPAASLAVGAEVKSEPGVRRALEIGPATVELAPSSRITLLEAVGESRLIRLDAGEIAVHVQKLAPPATFAIQTPDARVAVHGTRFVVKVLGPEQPSPRTRVHVSEGVVSVTYAGTESFVSAGASWPGAVPTSAPAQKLEPPPAAPPLPGPRQAALPKATPAPTPAPTSVALAEQNQLFSSAVAARRRGDDRTALAELDRLLRKYPNGPLAPEARVERFRALKRLGQSEAAAREAKKYLLENKDGYARDEARELVLPPKQK